MDIKNIFLLILILTSCGKKGEGSSGVTPLFPASESESITTNNVLLEDHGLRLLDTSPLPNNPPALICFNTQTLNHQKLSLLNRLVDAQNEFNFQLYRDAIHSLEMADQNSRFCPKIYLAIGL